MSVTYLLPIY